MSIYASPNSEEVYNPKIRQSAVERRQMSLFTKEDAVLVVADQNQNPVVVDAMTVAVKVSSLYDSQDDPETQTFILDPEAVRMDSGGEYRAVLPAEATARPGQFEVVWSYKVGQQEFEFTQGYEVLEHMPLYDSLSDGEKGIIEQTVWMLGDLYDNTTGGSPFFAEEFQTHFSYERLARLLTVTVNRINSTRSPVTTFGVGPGTRRFPEKWHGLLQLGLYLEVLRHFIRTYVEQPTIQGTQVAQVDRRDYMNRWKIVLDDEKSSYDSMLAQFKRSQMNLGSGRVLVSGGLYTSGLRFPSAAVRGFRFYPTSTVVVR